MHVHRLPWPVEVLQQLGEVRTLDDSTGPRANSLIVTIEAPEIDVELYTPIMNQTAIVTELGH